MSDESKRFTRGHGLLEPLVAKLRARQANRLIPARLRSGRILDVGCGSQPYFLSHTSFREKYAIDQLTPAGGGENIAFHALDLNTDPKLPYEDCFFQVVTMLAVVEHLNPSSLVQLFREIHRVLAPGGLLVATTPASWSDGLLRRMARTGLLSAEEIFEHKYAYTLPLLGWYFGIANFSMDRIRFGYFECGLNMWATAEREAGDGN
ncbi:MAG: class I SAM-dependent methyltransferase [Verrucomicrobiia bacterium]|jgi:SAM-dependent methyltransferase